MKKRWSILVASGAVAAILGAQGAASAANGGAAPLKSHPSGCHYEKYTPDGSQGARAWCNKSNGGHYRAIVVCVRWANGERIDREALAWKSGGKDSIVFCPPESFTETPGVMTKAS
ncbi:hypothetical protein [Streptomyces sp. NPDC015414]|uniref:hypothetical protein n=1 Tax=Streptomyces sp. NPDC015414 TaxID=3364957 RepID=UPI0036FB5C59